MPRPQSKSRSGSRAASAAPIASPTLVSRALETTAGRPASATIASARSMPPSGAALMTSRSTASARATASGSAALRTLSSAAIVHVDAVDAAAQLGELVARSRRAARRTRGRTVRARGRRARPRRRSSRRSRRDGCARPAPSSRRVSRTRATSSASICPRSATLILTVRHPPKRLSTPAMRSSGTAGRVALTGMRSRRAGAGGLASTRSRSRPRARRTPRRRRTRGRARTRPSPAGRAAAAPRGARCRGTASRAGCHHVRSRRAGRPAAAPVHPCPTVCRSCSQLMQNPQMWCAYRSHCAVLHESRTLGVRGRRTGDARPGARRLAAWPSRTSLTPHVSEQFDAARWVSAAGLRRPHRPHVPPRHERAHRPHRVRPARGAQRVPPAHGRRAVPRTRRRAPEPAHRRRAADRQRAEPEGRRLGVLFGRRPAHPGAQRVPVRRG